MSYSSLQNHSIRKNKHINFFDEESEMTHTMCPVTKTLELVEGTLRSDGLALICNGCGKILE